MRHKKIKKKAAQIVGGKKERGEENEKERVHEENHDTNVDPSPCAMLRSEHEMECGWKSFHLFVASSTITEEWNDDVASLGEYCLILLSRVFWLY